MFKTHRFLAFLFSVLLFMIIGSHLYGQSGIFDRTGIIPGHGSYSSLSEESVDLFTGNLTLSFRDIFLPGPNGLNIEVWRVYNSKILQDKLQSQPNPTIQAYPMSMVGIGWTMHMGIIHQYGSSTPVIEFPDGRREMAFPPKSEYGYNSNIRLTRDFLKYDKGLYPIIDPKLYFKNGVIWTFGNSATLPLGNGSSETVLMVTRIEDPYGNYIDIEYDPDDSFRSIKKISDNMEREVRFAKSYQGSNPAKLAEIWVRNYDNSKDVIYSYSVGSFSNGFYKLVSFTPPLPPPTTYGYNDGLSNNYELTSVTTSFGGVLEYSYENHSFYFNTTQLDSRVVSQKRITFNPGEQAKVWDYTYPTYQGASTGTATVVGPEYGVSATHYGYESLSANRWRIGLQTAHATSDGSASIANVWNYHEISTTSWSVLGVNMGTAKGPLVASVTESRTGDSTLKRDFYYLRTGVKRYGLPTKLIHFVNGSPSAKSSKELVYFFEAHGGFKDRYMLAFIENEKDKTASGDLLRETISSYFEEAGKWGALKQVKRWKSGSTYLTWDYGYSSAGPEHQSITIDGPGNSGISLVQYHYGLEQGAHAPDFLKYTRFVTKYSYIYYEWNQYGAAKGYVYDDLGRITFTNFYHDWIKEGDPQPPPPPPYLTVNYDWRPDGENKVVISRGGNTITRYWDGMGRDLGYTESDDNITLCFLKILDAEGRVKEETNGGVDPGHNYSYIYNASGRVTRVTDPVSEVTTISYSGDHTRTITDAEDHATVYEYNDLPGLPTRLTDAQGHAADYTYDAIGRLRILAYLGRTQSYVYNGLDQVESENHPETGLISYFYDTANRLAMKSWGGTQQNFSYNASGQIVSTTGAETVTYGYDEKGAVESAAGSTGWSRTGIKHNDFGAVTDETITIPGLGAKTLKYGYDDYGNLTETIYPDEKAAELTFNGLNRPETLMFDQTNIANEASYGPNKILAGLKIGKTSMSSTFYNNGTPNTVSLMKDSTPLYNATYAYDGAGNITGITSTAPALNASFAYDSLNRLTSATYSERDQGAPWTYDYEYDAYGNMLIVRHDGNVAFSKTYKASNQINDPDYQYDSRGNLTAAPGKFYEWDTQNRLRTIRDASGQYVADYRYDDRGLRITSLPPMPDINVVNYATGSNADITASLQSPTDKTFTISNGGHGTLTIGDLSIAGQDAGLFTVYEGPGSPIPPGQSTDFVIRFLPTSTGDKAATFSIVSNDPDENPYVINLRGYCEPEMDMGGVPNGGTYDFGEVTVGQSESETLFIVNGGTATLILYDGWPIEIEQPGGEQNFYLEGQTGDSEIPALGSNTFTVRFAPMGEGLKTATVTIWNNDLNDDPYTITLAGTGLNGPQKIIDDASLTLLSPNGGEKIAAGSLQAITWTGGERVKDVKLEYSVDNGSTYRTIIEQFSNVGMYPWRVPAELSGSCLVRISDADGTPTAPVVVSFEFNFRVSATEEDPQASQHFVFRAGLPDLRTQTFQVAEVAFAPDGVRGSENLLFNYALGEVQELGRFLGTWHHARITYDMTNYTGSVWIDNRPIVSGVPLKTDLDVERTPEISLSRGPEVAVKLWVDDLDVRFADLSQMGQGQPEIAFRPLFRDNFNRYESALFLKEGGWLPGQEQARAGEQSQGETAEEGAQVLQAARTEAAAESSSIDDGIYASSAKSFRLEGSPDEPGTVVKRFSMPERIPYCVSADNFSIVEPGWEAQTERADRAISEKEDGKEVKRQKRWDGGTPGGKSGRAVDRSQPERSRTGTNPIRCDAAEEPGSTKMLSGPLPSGTYYIYSFDGRLLAEYNLLGQCVRDYIYFGGQLVAEYRAGAFYYYASDQVNSTRIVTDGEGNVVYSAAHEPYGGIQKTWTSTYDPALKFSGKERDEESELDYFGARFYDKALYRFLTVDPMIPRGAFLYSQQRWNLYSYCLGNPVKYLDPDGAEAIDFIIMRLYIQDNMIHGVMYSVDQKFQASTMEPLFTDGKRGSAIPDGTYSATPGMYMGKFALKLSGEGLEGRKIWIHFGTFREFTTGCFIIGTIYSKEEQKMIGSALRLIELENYIKSQMNSLGSATMNQRFFLDEIMLSWLHLDYISWLMDSYEWKTEIKITVLGLDGLQGMDH